MATGAAARVEALIELRRYEDAVAEARRGLAAVVQGVVAGLIGVGLLAVAAVAYLVLRRRRMAELSAPAQALVREGRRAP